MLHLNHDNLYQAKMIVCVMSRGLSNQVVEALYEKKHIVISESLPVRNQGSTMLQNRWIEMDMLKVIVMPQYADDIFEFIFQQGKVAETEGSYMFQMNVPWATHFELPAEEALNTADKD
ncbi:hypothetical protein [Hydrogenovibrio kuenenii]|uniref:hypothetical protein n=1 Tax=Hydrogenovibrio kuenenii TaxID=63658 RepID=UPI000464A2F6|nr:hypothetical protein [Hydrogenovibrio kuenenii]